MYGSESWSEFTKWYRRILPDAVVRFDDRVERVLMYRDIKLSIDHAPALAAPSALTVQYLLPFDSDTARDVWSTFSDRYLVDGPEGTHVRLTPETNGSIPITSPVSMMNEESSPTGSVSTSPIHAASGTTSS